MTVMDTTMRMVESASGAHMRIDGQTILNFGGSGYLGLASEPQIVGAGIQALKDLGGLCQLPRHYGFQLTANQAAEAAAREYFGIDGAMYFGAGYLFGLIALTGLSQEFDVVFLDESAHYSLRDGAAIAGKPVHTFKHRDAHDLRRVMQRELAAGQRPLVATDGMFPTFGSIAPLADYASVLAPHNGWMVVDESHSFGCVGATGRGAVEQAGIARERVVAGGSMGKAFGAHGGLAIGSRHAIESMWRTPAARGAALGLSAGAAMTAASLRYVREHPERLERLRANARHLKNGLRRLGLQINDSEGPVATFVRGDASSMQRLQSALMQQGIFVIYSTYVGAGPDGAIRCACFADHEPAHIERLFTALAPFL